MLNKDFSNNINLKELLDLAFFIFIYIILYFSIIKDFKLKRLISLLGIFYFSIYNLKYALITIIILFIEQENNNFFEYFKNQDDNNPVKHLYKAYKVTTNNLGNATRDLGNAISKHGKDVNDNYNKSQEEETVETFINMDNITGSMKGMVEFVHNNNSIGKIRENLKTGAQKFIKDSLNFKESKIINEEDTEEDSKNNEDSNDSGQESEDEDQENFSNRYLNKKNKRGKKAKTSRHQHLLIEHLNNNKDYDQKFDIFKKDVTENYDYIKNDLLKLKKNQ